MTTILQPLKEFLATGRRTEIVITEASGLTGSGDNIGGRIVFTPAMSALRMANPLRAYTRSHSANGKSDVSYTRRTGNATPANPWGYPVTNNTGTPNYDTTFWQIPTRAVAFQLPIRTAVLDQVDGLSAEVERDIMMELGTLEGLSAMRNGDQSGSTTTATGATSGLRGLSTYPSGTAAYGSSGRNLTDGVHTIANVNFSLAAADTAKYASIEDATNSLPAQYWQRNPCWMVHPSAITYLRKLKDSNGLPIFLDFGDYDAAPVGGNSFGKLAGFHVVVNSNLPVAGAGLAAGDIPMYLADWESAVTITDEMITLERYEQTTPGSITIFGQLRTCMSIVDPFAIVRVTVTA